MPLEAGSSEAVVERNDATEQHASGSRMISDNYAQDEMALDKSARSVDDDGHMVVRRCLLTKAVVNPYKGEEIPGWQDLGLEKNKIYQLYRDPKALKEGCSSLEGKPLLIEHRPITADDHQPRIVGGSIFNPQWDETQQAIFGDISVWRQDAIDDIEGERKRDLSMGYRYIPVMQPGTTSDGIPYDGKMTSIKFNHCATVSDGRVEGAMVADSADELEWAALDEALRWLELGAALDSFEADEWHKIAAALDADWKEGDHPRRPDGKFGTGGSKSAKTSAKSHPAKRPDGGAVSIKEPHTPTDYAKIADAKKTATFVPGKAVKGDLSGIPFKSWTPPKTAAGWDKVQGQKAALDTPFEPTEGKHIASGVAIMEPDGRIWLTAPTNKYGGYEATFPKGTVEHGMNMQAAAIKEAYEETGLQVELTGILGDFEKTTSKARIYLAKRVGGTPADMGWESQGLHLATKDEAKKLLNQTVDKPIIGAAFGEKRTDAAKEAWGKPPGAPDPKAASEGKSQGDKVASNAGGTLKDLPASKMREYSDKEFPWEYREYTKYGSQEFPGAFESEADFKKQYESAPMRSLSRDELKNLDYSTAGGFLGATVEKAHKAFSHRRDTKRIEKDLLEGKSAPPIVLKIGKRLRILGGNTRLSMAAAHGYSMPVKVIDISKSQDAHDQALDAEWKEEQHKRDKGGKFSKTAESGGPKTEEGKPAPEAKEAKGKKGLISFLQAAGGLKTLKSKGFKPTKASIHYMASAELQKAVALLKGEPLPEVASGPAEAAIPAKAKADVKKAAKEGTKADLVAKIQEAGGFKALGMKGTAYHASKEQLLKAAALLGAKPKETKTEDPDLDKWHDEHEPPEVASEWEKVQSAIKSMTPEQKTQLAQKIGEKLGGQPGSAGSGSGSIGTPQGKVEWKASWTPETATIKQSAAIHAYCNEEYEAVNWHLRGIPPKAESNAYKPEEHSKVIKYLDQVIDNCEYNGKIWRGLSVNQREAFLKNGFMEPGAEFEDKGFGSFSRKESFAKDWKGGFTIETVGGKRCAQVEKLSQHGSTEAEIITGRNMKFRTVSWDPATRVLKVDIIDDDAHNAPGFQDLTNGKLDEDPDPHAYGETKHPTSNHYMFQHSLNYAEMNKPSKNQYSPKAQIGAGVAHLVTPAKKPKGSYSKKLKPDTDLSPEAHAKNMEQIKQISGMSSWNSAHKQKAAELGIKAGNKGAWFNKHASIATLGGYSVNSKTPSNIVQALSNAAYGGVQPKHIKKNLPDSQKHTPIHSLGYNDLVNAVSKAQEYVKGKEQKKAA